MKCAARLKQLQSITMNAMLTGIFHADSGRSLQLFLGVLCQLVDLVRLSGTAGRFVDSSVADALPSPTTYSWFLASKGNEYFCEVDEDYIIDRFNLTGLNAEVQGYSSALELITDAAGTRRRVALEQRF